VPRFQVPQYRIQGELGLSAGRLQPAADALARAASLDPPAYGKEYWAFGLEALGRKAEALVEYQQSLKAKPFQLRILTPDPAGAWRRAQTAIARLEAAA
jgi:tetratricopeptide (TPR) repeat protein